MPTMTTKRVLAIRLKNNYLCGTKKVKPVKKGGVSTPFFVDFVKWTTAGALSNYSSLT